VPIRSPDDYSKLLEVSTTLFNQSDLPSSPDSPACKKSPRNWSIAFKPKNNSTLTRDPRVLQARLNAAAKNKDSTVVDMGNQNGDQDSNPDPPADPIATVEIHENNPLPATPIKP
jgi:hypothetical protein